MIKNYVAFDLETTGLDVEQDYIIEIGALKVIDGKVCDRFMEFLKPPIAIPKQIQIITGIDDSMVACARETEMIIRDFATFCEGNMLVGHNILFDYKFMKKYMNAYRIPFEKQGIDTLKIARKVHRGMESKSLGTLCEHYNITNKAAHRAYHDALATAKVYHMLAHEFETEYSELFQPECLQYKPKKVQPCTAKQIEYLQLLCKYHHLPVPKEATGLTRSEASKLIDSIISEHGLMRFEER